MGILEELKKGVHIDEIATWLGVSRSTIYAVRKKNISEIPVKDEGKILISGRLVSPLMKQVLTECERLGINRNDFLEMVTKFYFNNKKGPWAGFNG